MTKVLAISGSLRKQSHNTALLRTLQNAVPGSWDVSIHIPRGYPVYDEDLQKKEWPASVLELEQEIRRADCIVIATPEYNHSIPGGLKNMLDWISRRPDQPFGGKLVGIMGVSSGRMGAVRAQIHLRQCLQCLGANVINRPEILVGNADQVFANGVLTDPASLDALQAFLAALEQRLGAAAVVTS